MTPKPNHDTELKLKAALHAVCEDFLLSPHNLRNRSRDAYTTEARMFYWFLLLCAEGTFVSAGAHSLGFTHAAAYHANRKAIAWLRIYPIYRLRYDRLVASFHRYLKSFAPGPRDCRNKNQSKEANRQRPGASL